MTATTPAATGPRRDTDAPDRFLRRVLAVDAAASAATGLLLLVAGGLLERHLALPASFTFPAGLALLPFAAFVGAVATRPRPAGPAVETIVAGNVLWTLGSVALIISGSMTPTLLGTGFVMAQAGVVGLLAVLQAAGLRRRSASAALGDV